MTKRTPHPTVPLNGISTFTMRLFVILFVMTALTLASGARLSAIKRRRESKWDIIHHEYHGPPAPLSKDGRVIDTPEVALARANHLAIHAETVIDLARKMAEAEALEAKHRAEEAAKQAPEVEARAAEGEAAPEAAPIVVESVEMTPELMAMLTAAAAEEQQQAQGEQQQAEEAPASEAAPAAEAEAAAPASEAPAAETEAAAPAAEAESAAPAAEAEAAAPEAQPVAEVVEKVSEAPKEEETKPVVEPEANNEIDAEHPQTIQQKSYEGPLAPLGEDGRVLDTPEVRKAKEAHLLAYEQAVKLTKAKEEESKKDGESEPAWYEARKRIYIPPVHLLYHHDGPIGYKGPAAPIGKLGHVVDTQEVERAKSEHRKAHEQAKTIAERNPPKAEDNLV